MCLGSEISGRVLITSVLFLWMPTWSMISKYTQCFHIFQVTEWFVKNCSDHVIALFRTFPVLSIYTQSQMLCKDLPSSYDTQSLLCLSLSLNTSPPPSLSSICDGLIIGFWMSRPCFCLKVFACPSFGVDCASDSHH